MPAGDAPQEEPPKLSRLQVRVWFLSAMGIFLDGFDLFILGVALPLIARDLGIGPYQQGLPGPAAVPPVWMQDDDAPRQAVMRRAPIPEALHAGIRNADGVDVVAMRRIDLPAEEGFDPLEPVRWRLASHPAIRGAPAPGPCSVGLLEALDQPRLFFGFHCPSRRAVH